MSVHFKFIIYFFNSFSHHSIVFITKSSINTFLFLLHHTIVHIHSTQHQLTLCTSPSPITPSSTFTQHNISSHSALLHHSSHRLCPREVHEVRLRQQCGFSCRRELHTHAWEVMQLNDSDEKTKNRWRKIKIQNIANGI